MIVVVLFQLCKLQFMSFSYCFCCAVLSFFVSSTLIIVESVITEFSCVHGTNDHSNHSEVSHMKVPR